MRRIGDVAVAAAAAAPVAFFVVVLLAIRVEDVGDFLFERDAAAHSSCQRGGAGVLTIFRVPRLLLVLVAGAFHLARLRLLQTVAPAHSFLTAPVSSLGRRGTRGNREGRRMKMKMSSNVRFCNELSLSILYLNGFGARSVGEIGHAQMRYGARVLVRGIAIRPIQYKKKIKSNQIRKEKRETKERNQSNKSILIDIIITITITFQSRSG